MTLKLKLLWLFGICLQVSKAKAQKWCKKRGELPLFETSARDDVNVGAAFEVVAQRALKRGEEEADLIMPDNIIEINHKNADQGCAC